ncbi:type II toxin-antitoxin system HigB family toxin [Deinococcus peraridilitoris]|uniref:mRNA interferase HigB n=1 Tax=Deinococcus peraridilitoris (strain DSM 19664 / LMG 22246 / CIP 109416 / KR-200) TaxID=937777 RepID=K9ZW10_DEIPD|nr:type II toxin-antitoxin system HigB family toxin [Deinococcus peraridilitoris]AFZ65746.1 hypothetical protein Deipe_0141 [Deinococcus peraridilitoris DSM 19664]
MNVIAFKTLQAFAAECPDAEASLAAWYKHVRAAEYRSFADVKADFGSADWVEGFIVFNIGGNKYRLIVSPNFTYKTFFVKHILTHRQYDNWEP